MKKQLDHFLFVWSFTITATIFINCSLYAQSSISAFRDESGKYGFKNKTGIIIPAKYDSAYNFEYGLGRVKLNNKWGFIDEKGQVITPIKYFWIEPAVFMDIYDDAMYEEPTGWYRMKLNSKADPWKYVDKTGKDLLFDDYNDAGYSEGMLEVASANKWGFADGSGKVVVPTKYQEVNYFRKGRATVKFNNKWGLIDKTGKEITSLKYDTIGAIKYGKEDWYKFKLNDKFGLIDSMGNEVIHAKYEDIIYFSEGLAAFKLNGKWGYVDKTGKEIIPAQYDVAYTFTGGKANVKKDGKSFRIDSPLLEDQDQMSNPGTKAITPSVTLVKPPLPLKGKIDPGMVGLWKYTDATGRITYMKMNADGTSESYLNSVTPANKSKGFCYWLIDGNFYESVCDGFTSVSRYSFQKGYDKETGKPTLTLAGYVYIAADNKTSW
jgi:hypothetical protein